MLNAGLPSRNLLQPRQAFPVPLQSLPVHITLGEIMDIRSYNREAWNKEVEGGENRWTQPARRP